MRYLITLFLVLTTTLSIVAQGADKRPKIGLVLSGGGAKGLAHVGVLKAIDKAGLTIDYISGTSMGAIIAAMYATGYSGEEIEIASSNIDWMSMMSGNVDYKDISIEEKPEYENVSITVPLNGLKLSPFTGVKEPQEVMLKFAEVFFPVYKTKDFNDLNIPFRCIAADLSNGEAVVLDKGDLAFAVRSSMAIPGVFEATNYGSTKLVDGGIVRNFPVKDVKEMGADFVIGVNLFSGLYEPHDLTTAVDVMMQITNFRDAEDLIDEKRHCDMIIEPDVTGYNAASFGSCNEILAIGDSAGYDFYPLFKQLADSLHNHYGLEYSQKERMPEHYETVVIKSLDIVGLKHTDQELLMHNLTIKVGESYTVQQLNDAFRKAYSSQYYTNLTYELIPIDDENGVSLKCNVEENPLSSLKIGLSYNTFSNASLILGYSHKNLIGQRSITDVKVALSESFRFRLKNRMYFGATYDHYFDAYYEYSTYDLPIYQNNKKEYVYDYKHNDFALQVGHIFNKSHELIVKAGFESFNITPDVSERGREVIDINNILGNIQIDSLNSDKYKDKIGEVADSLQSALDKEVNERINKKLNGRISNIYFNIKHHYNTLNRKHLPQKGVNLNNDLYIALKPKYKFDFEDYDDKRETVFRFTSDLAMYQPLNDRTSLYENVSLALSYGRQTLVHQTALGGELSFLPSHMTFYGLTTAQCFEEGLCAFRFGIQHRIVDELYGLLHINSAATFYSIDKYKNKVERGFKEYIHGIGATLAYNFSYLPFDLTLMYSSKSKFNVSVNVGFLF